LRSGDLHSLASSPDVRQCWKFHEKSQTAHHGLRSDDLGTNRLSTGPLLGDGAAAARPGERRCFTVSSPFCTSVDVLSGFAGLTGNNALDQPRARSSGVGAEVVRAACGPGTVDRSKVLLVPRGSDCRQGALLVLRGWRPGSLAAREGGSHPA